MCLIFGLHGRLSSLPCICLNHGRPCINSLQIVIVNPYPLDHIPYCTTVMSIHPISIHLGYDTFYCLIMWAALPRLASGCETVCPTVGGGLAQSCFECHIGHYCLVKLSLKTLFYIISTLSCILCLVRCLSRPLAVERLRDWAATDLPNLVVLAIPIIQINCSCQPAQWELLLR